MSEDNKINNNAASEMTAGFSERLGKINQKFEGVPNVMGILSESPMDLKSYAQISNTFGGTSFSDTEKFIVLLTVSRMNDSKKSLDAHISQARELGVPEEIIKATCEDQVLADEKLESLRQLAKSVIEKRGWIEKEDAARFLDAGYLQGQLHEVIVGVSLKTLSRYIDDITEEA